MPFVDMEKAQAIARLTEKRDEYVERLDIGAAKIEQARSEGKDVTSWEDYWIQLLRQYEAVCDKLRELKGEKEQPNSRKDDPIPEETPDGPWPKESSYQETLNDLPPTEKKRLLQG